MDPLSVVRCRKAAAGKEQWPRAAGMAGSGVARTTGSAEHPPRSWHCPVSAPTVLGAVVAAGWTCHGHRCREPISAMSTAARGSTAGRTWLHITTSPHPAVPNRLPVPRSPAPAPCPQLGPGFGGTSTTPSSGHQVEGAWHTSGCICWGCGTPQWAHRGLLPHAGIGQRGVFLCHGSAAADPHGGRAANTRRCSAGKGDLAPATGDEERGTSPRTAAPTWERGQCRQPQCWGGPEVSDPGTIIYPWGGGSGVVTDAGVGVLSPS